MSRFSVSAVSLVVVVLGLVAILLVVVEPGGSRRGGRFPRAPLDVPAAKPGFTLSKEWIGPQRIPALVLSRDESAKRRRPAVILIHGGAIVDPVETRGLHYKEIWFDPDFEDVPYRLARAGMLVIAMDAWWAEERYKPEYSDLVHASPLAAIFHGFAETAQDVSRVVDCLCVRDDVDPKRIGLAGKSGGAITSLIAACEESRLEAVVAWKGGADFVEMTRLRGQGALVSQALSHDATFKDRIQRMDPIYNYQSIPPKAIALIGNREDPLVPRQGAEKLYEKLRPLYEQYPERLKLLLLDTAEPTHDDQPAALAAGCQWLERFLLDK